MAGIHSHVLFAPFQSVTCSCNTALKQVIESVISEIGNALLPIFSIQSHQCPSEREKSTLYNLYQSSLYFVLAIRQALFCYFPPDGGDTAALAEVQ